MGVMYMDADEYRRLNDEVAERVKGQVVALDHGMLAVRCWEDEGAFILMRLVGEDATGKLNWHASAWTDDDGKP